MRQHILRPYLNCIQSVIITSIPGISQQSTMFSLSSLLSSHCDPEAEGWREKVHTVAVLGASYGGFRAAQLLATSLPNGWRVVLIERNLNNVYNFAPPALCAYLIAWQNPTAWIT
ncbi:hypothetical protein EV401DRAFT_914682 [Pisolithus croceorrhizus]|nr:hypothetical protein EV401DRAFT_914682 [Pisolithus croceorrhizus]